MELNTATLATAARRADLFEQRKAFGRLMSHQRFEILKHGSLTEHEAAQYELRNELETLFDEATVAIKRLDYLREEILQVATMERPYITETAPDVLALVEKLTTVKCRLSQLRAK